jgi:hypothetical protein
VVDDEMAYAAAVGVDLAIAEMRRNVRVYPCLGIHQARDYVHGSGGAYETEKEQAVHFAKSVIKRRVKTVGGNVASDA